MASTALRSMTNARMIPIVPENRMMERPGRFQRGKSRFQAAFLIDSFKARPATGRPPRCSPSAGIPTSDAMRRSSVIAPFLSDSPASFNTTATVNGEPGVKKASSISFKLAASPASEESPSTATAFAISIILRVVSAPGDMSAQRS